MSKKLTQEEFVDKVKSIHGDKIDLSETIYTRYRNKTKFICPKHGVFWTTPISLITGHGCPRCSHHISKQESKWLDSVELNENIIILRQHTIRLNNRTYRVDGYCEETNIVYEFNGDYWHGNPAKYDQNKINKKSNKTFGELYQRTKDKVKLLEEAGYKVISIWESDYLE